MQLPVRVVDDLRDGRIGGYVCNQSTKEGAVPEVLESAIGALDVGMFVLRQLKAEAEGNIRIDWPQTGTLVQLAEVWAVRRCRLNSGWCVLRMLLGC